MATVRPAYTASAGAARCVLRSRVRLCSRARAPGSGGEIFPRACSSLPGCAALSAMHWQYAKRRLAPSIPTRRRASTTSPTCCGTRATLPGRGRCYERALAIREKALGPEHPDTATSLNNLAILLKAEGDFAGARPLYERALAICEKVLGPEHPDTATSLNNLANLLRDQGDFAGRDRCYERALAIREKALGPEHPDTATSLNNLAVPAAEPRAISRRRAPLFERALSDLRKGARPRASRCGVEPQSTWPSCCRPRATSRGAAALRARAGDPREGARPRASRHGEEPQQPGQPAARRRATLPARGRCTSGRWPYTKRRSARTIPILRRASTTSPSCCRPRATLPGRFRSCERALAIREKVLGRAHPDTTTSLDSLAVLLEGQGDSRRRGCRASAGDGGAAMKLPRRQFLHLAAGAAALPAVSRIARAQAYPTRPVRIIVGYAAGRRDRHYRAPDGPMAVGAARSAIHHREPAGCRQQYRHRGGRAGAPGRLYAASGRASECRSTRRSTTSSTTISYATSRRSRASLAFGNVMEVNPTVPVKTVPEFIAYAKANPGQDQLRVVGCWLHQSTCQRSCSR